MLQRSLLALLMFSAATGCASEYVRLRRESHHRWLHFFEAPEYSEWARCVEMSANNYIYPPENADGLYLLNQSDADLNEYRSTIKTKTLSACESKKTVVWNDDRSIDQPTIVQDAFRRIDEMIDDRIAAEIEEEGLGNFDPVEVFFPQR